MPRWRTDMLGVPKPRRGDMAPSSAGRTLQRLRQRINVLIKQHQSGADVCIGGRLVGGPNVQKSGEARHISNMFHAAEAIRRIVRHH